MRHIKIISPGRTKESWLQEALDEYEKRLRPTMQLEWILLKRPDLLKQALSIEKKYICLEPKGSSLTSEGFAQLVLQEQAHTFVIGGPEGIPKELQYDAAHIISFSKLTFTHQQTRLILAEQLYRTAQIEKGSKYHK